MSDRFARPSTFLSPESRSGPPTWARTLGVLAFLLLSRPLVAQTILVVDTVVDDPQATACLDGAPNDCSLRGAITLANGIPAPEVVIVELFLGDFPLTVDGPGEDANQTGDLDVLRSLTIRGFHEQLSDIEGGGAGGLDDRVFDIHGAGTLLVLEDLTVRDSVPPADLHAIHVRPGASLRFTRGRVSTSGSLSDGGGAIRLEPGASAAISSSRIWYNGGLQGAGILVHEAALFVLDSYLGHNVAADRGGAIAILDDTTGEPEAVRIERSHIDDNNASSGAGIWAGHRTQLELVDDYFENNEANVQLPRLGGGVYSNGSVEVEGTTFFGGFANHGVALFLEPDGPATPNLDLTNSTVSGASTDPLVSAIWVEQTTTEFLNVTTMGNQYVARVSQSPFKVSKSVFEGDCLVFNGSAVTSDGGNLGLSSSCWGSLPGAGLVVFQLGLGPLGFHGGFSPVHRPSSVSPVNGYVLGPCLSTDQRGYTRPAAFCDTGAVERAPVEAIFVDDFEQGGTGAWSNVTF